MFVRYMFRRTGMGARTETIILKIVNGEVERIEPYRIERSRTGNHGLDYYRKEDIDKADVIVTIDISNSGKHYCHVAMKRKLVPAELAKLTRWLEENEHLCPSMIESMARGAREA